MGRDRPILLVKVVLPAEFLGHRREIEFKTPSRVKPKAIRFDQGCSIGACDKFPPPMNRWMTRGTARVVGTIPRAG